MSSEQPIYPRSPRESMAGWIILPRFIDKIRLHFAGMLHTDYQPNLGKPGSFDDMWMQAAGVDQDTFFEVVKTSITDGEVCDWVRTHAKADEAAKAALVERVMKHGNGDALAQRLVERKAESGLADRDDIQCFVDYIDADEGRL